MSEIYCDIFKPQQKQQQQQQTLGILQTNKGVSF